MIETVLTKWQACWNVLSLWEALLALWCHLWAYFGFFLLAADITVPAEFCSISWAVLRKKCCSAFCFHPFHWCIPVQVKEANLGGPVSWDVTVYVFVHEQIIINKTVLSDTCAACSMCISSCSGSCSSFLTPPFIHASLGRVSTSSSMVECEVGQRISTKAN